MNETKSLLGAQTKMESSRAWKWWRKFGANPICLAPMAEINDLSWRMLMRKHGVRVCWTGMLNAFQWSQGAGYQDKFFTTCKEDRPLIAQIAGSNHDQIINAAKDLSKFCDGIDINLGCTQKIASRSQYGYFMVDTQQKRDDTIELFKKLTKSVNVPICAKIRIFLDDNGEISEPITIAFAKALEESGVSLIQIHGRAEHRNKQAVVMTDIVKHLVDSVHIPVIANGGIQTIEDANSIIKTTGAAGVSVGQALLKDPTAFDPINHLTKQEAAAEYMNLSIKHNVRFFGPQKHIFQLYGENIQKDNSIAEKIKQCKTVEELLEFVKENP